MERDLTLSIEALALFVHYWLTLIPSLPESTQAAPTRTDASASRSLSKRLGRRIATGKSLLCEISIDVEAKV